MDVTQWLGTIGFAIAGLMCLARLRPSWVLIGLANLYFGADCAWDLRHRFRMFAIDAMGSLYAERGPYQIGLMIGAVLLGAVILVLVARLARDRSTRIAFVATAMSAGLFALEIISLHVIDGVLYTHVGPALLIGWLWLASASITALAASSDALSRSKSS